MAQKDTQNIKSDFSLFREPVYLKDQQEDVSHRRGQIDAVCNFCTFRVNQNANSIDQRDLTGQSWIHFI